MGAAVKHDWYLDSDEEVDVFRVDSIPHMGPQCQRCGDAFCVLCDPERMNEECPGDDIAGN